MLKLGRKPASQYEKWFPTSVETSRQIRDFGPVRVPSRTSHAIHARSGLMDTDIIGISHHKGRVLSHYR